MKKIITICIGLLPIISLALPVKSGERFRVQIPGEFIVKTNGEKIQQKIIKKLGKNVFLIHATSQMNLKNVRKVFPNYAYYGDYKDVMPSTPNDADFSNQFHHTMIQTLDAWPITKGNKEVIVAVTDNEFQIDHRDLQTTWWKNNNEIPNNGIDDDQNGYIDDVFGWDFIGEDNNVDSDEEPTHGTHVAGIIAATANNKRGGSGIAPGVKVMPLKWYGNERRWTSAIIYETYRYAVDMGAKIISTSYNIDGFVDDEAYLDAVSYARENNVLIFNSAGNSGQKNPPRQKIEEVILVCSVKSASERSQDKKSSFSNYGDGIDICAPGDPVYSTVQSPSNSPSGEQNRYGNLQGTSMAAPAAAAVAALIWSAHPNFSDDEVRQRLYDSADDIDHRNFWYRGKLGAGRINASKAVE